MDSFLKNFQLRSLKFSNLRHRQVIRSRPALNASMLTANIRAFILLILRVWDVNLISQRDRLIALVAEKRITALIRRLRPDPQRLQKSAQDHFGSRLATPRACAAAGPKLPRRLERRAQRKDCRVIKKPMVWADGAISWSSSSCLVTISGPPCRHHRPLSAVIRRSTPERKQRQAHRAFHIALNSASAYWLLKVQLIKLGGVRAWHQRGWTSRPI